MKKKALLLLLMAMEASIAACGSEDTGSGRGTIAESNREDRKEDDEKERMEDSEQKIEETAAENETPASDAAETEVPADTVAPAAESAPEPAPEYTGITATTKDLDGNAVNLQDVFSSNQYTIVNMWATWCGPCVGEIPELAELQSQLEAKGCGIVGLLVDGDTSSGRSEAASILSDAGAGYLNIVLTPELDRLFYSDYIPATFFVDQTGTILGDPIVGADPEAYLERVEDLLIE